jgi:hypothetical protein
MVIEVRDIFDLASTATLSPSVVAESNFTPSTATQRNRA